MTHRHVWSLETDTGQDMIKGVCKVCGLEENHEGMHACSEALEYNTVRFPMGALRSEEILGDRFRREI